MTMHNHIKKIYNNIDFTTKLSSLSATKLAEIQRPDSIMAAKVNFKKYYNCVGNTFRVYQETTDKNGNPIKFSEGQRVQSEWELHPRSQLTTEPHPAVVRQRVYKSHVVTDIDIRQMSNLSDIYAITETGWGSNKFDPSFTMNVWFKNHLANCSTTYALVLLAEAHSQIGYDFHSDWLKCEDLYDIYDNSQPLLSDDKGFSRFIESAHISHMWQQLNNWETRYLHWLLLGPFAPYDFDENENEQAA